MLPSLSKFKNYFLYALPALPLALLGLPLYVYLPTFYAQDVGLGVFGVGLVLLFARLFDMLSDPIVGYWSDHYFSRKTFMLFGAFLLLVGFYFLTHPAQNAGYLWLFSFSMLVYFGWSLVSIPYYALGADLGEGYLQNTHYASWRELFNISGVLLALVVPYLYGVSQEPKESLSLLNTLILFLLPLSLLFFVRGVNAITFQNHLISLKESLRIFFKELQKSRYLFGAFFLNSFANALPATLFLLYVELVIGAKEQAGLLLLLYFFSGIAALVFWNFLAKKTSKKRAWAFSMLNAIFFFAFVPFLGEGDFVLFLLITLFSGMSLGADMALPASMQADRAHNLDGAPRELGGTLFGFFAMIVKLSLAFGVGVSFAILGLCDFDPSMPNATSLQALALLYGALPIALKLAALLTLFKHQESR
jgi:Na+/melibiose symporter-like transporter